MKNETEYRGVMIPEATKLQVTLCHLYIDAALSLSPDFSAKEIDPVYAENDFPYLLREFLQAEEDGWDFRIFVPFSGCEIAEEAKDVALLRGALGEPVRSEKLPVTRAVITLLNWQENPEERSCSQCRYWISCKHYEHPCKDCCYVSGHPQFVQRPIIDNY